jgi:hypothetical protein
MAEDGTALVATIEYTSLPGTVTFGDGWTGTGTTATYAGLNTDVSPVAFAYTIGGKTKTLQVSLATAELTRPASSTITYQVYGFDAANNAVGLRDATLQNPSSVSIGNDAIVVSTVSAPKTFWRYLPGSNASTGKDIKTLFDAICAPNSVGSPLDDFKATGEEGKTSIPYDVDIAAKVLQLFYVTLDTTSGNGNNDAVYISGKALPTLPTGKNYKSDGSNLIIIDIGLPNAKNELPKFYIPNQGLGVDAATTYPHIRFRVNNGASLSLLADNSTYESPVSSNRSTHGVVGAGSCPEGYFNNGCVEVMAGGQLRDGAFEGFPLGANAVILNRAGSYLAVGPERTFDYVWATNNSVDNAHYRWYAGWLIGPADAKPRIVWDNGNTAGKYIEVRPKEIAIDANVTVKKSVGLIYSVWFVGETTVTVDVDTTDTLALVSASGWGSSNPAAPIKGLAANNRNPSQIDYKFYGNEKASIVVRRGSYIGKSAIVSVNDATGLATFIGDATKDVTITGTADGTKKEYSTGTSIEGWSTWTVPTGTTEVKPN